MIEIFYFVTNILGSFPFLFCAETLSITLKVFVCSVLVLQGWQKTSAFKPLIFIILVLISAIFVDLAWVVWLCRKLFFPNMDYKIVLFLIRVSWAFSICQYQGLALFVESLIEKDYKLSPQQKFFVPISSCFAIFFIIMAFLQFTSPFNRPDYEYTMQKISTLYELGPLMFITLLITIRKIYLSNLPKILKKQLKIIIKYLIAPYIVLDFIQVYPFSFTTSGTGNFASLALSSALITYAIFYCSRKVMGLRFLNFHNHVQSSRRFNFINDFKQVLEQLSLVTSITELGHITQQFFKDAFGVPPGRISLYVRHLEGHEHDENYELNPVEIAVENFIAEQSDKPALAITRQSKILISDEVTFNNFYEENRHSKELEQFLNQISADIFMPIFKQETIIGYIIIDRDARERQVYSNVERDEMMVFASYLGNIINLLSNRNLNMLVQKEKEMKEELYSKHQEINQYKESIRSFLRDSQQRKIGIIFYKNRRFTLGNKEAKELIGININAQEGHPLSQALQKIAHQTEQYKISQTIFTKDINGNSLVLSCIPNLEDNNLIIMIYYPEISDIIKKQIDLLRNPSEWDYLLYLETTKTGQLINQLIPSNGELLLNFKIELLKLALSKKALLIEMAEEDLLATVELLHHISLREALHVLKLQNPCKGPEMAIKLFGINPIFGKTSEKPLLSSLDANGTLFIQNVEHLDLETQEHVAEYIRYGFYHVFKSEQKISSNVRIICSTNQNLKLLAQEGRFSANLLNELKKATIFMPSLLNLPEEEICELAEGYSQQALTTQEFTNFLGLTTKDKTHLSSQRPTSLVKFKAQVLQLLQQKSKNQNIVEDLSFDQGIKPSNPQLIQAARLGKKALKDQAVMKFLWGNFKNQNQIATFLGVNRSSVNRRCKEYSLID